MLTKRLLAGLVFPLLLVAGASAQSVQPRNDPPLAKRVLDGAWPKDAHALAIDSATLDQLGLHDDAHRLNDAWQRREIADLLGRATPVPATLRVAIAREVSAREPLERVRAALAREGVSIDFTGPSSGEAPDSELARRGRTKPQAIAQFHAGVWGAFDERAMRTSGREPGDAYLLLVRGLVHNHTTMTADIRLYVAVHGPIVMRCDAKAVPAGGVEDVFCAIESWQDTQRSKSIEVAEALASGRLAPRIVGVRVDTGAPRPILAVGEAAELTGALLKDSAAVMAAKKLIAQSGCRELGSCRRIAMGWVFNPGTIGMLIVAALMAWSARRRWLRAGDAGISASQSWFRGAFKLYLVLTCIGMALAMIDSPRVAGNGNPMTGLLSGLFNVALALPWSLLHQMQVDALPNAAMRDQVSKEMVLIWIFIMINLGYLGFMGYFNEPRAPSRQQRRPPRHPGDGGEW